MERLQSPSILRIHGIVSWPSKIRTLLCTSSVMQLSESSTVVFAKEELHHLYNFSEWNSAAEVTEFWKLQRSLHYPHRSNLLYVCVWQWAWKPFGRTFFPHDALDPHHGCSFFRGCWAPPMCVEVGRDFQQWSYWSRYIENFFLCISSYPSLEALDPNLLQITCRSAMTTSHSFPETYCVSGICNCSRDLSCKWCEQPQ